MHLLTLEWLNLDFELSLNFFGGSFKFLHKLHSLFDKKKQNFVPESNLSNLKFNIHSSAFWFGKYHCSSLQAMYRNEHNSNFSHFLNLSAFYQHFYFLNNRYTRTRLFFSLFSRVPDRRLPRTKTARMTAMRRMMMTMTQRLRVRPYMHRNSAFLWAH